MSARYLLDYKTPILSPYNRPTTVTVNTMSVNALGAEFQASFVTGTQEQYAQTSAIQRG